MSVIACQLSTYFGKLMHLCLLWWEPREKYCVQKVLSLTTQYKSSTTMHTLRTVVLDYYTTVPITTTQQASLCARRLGT